MRPLILVVNDDGVGSPGLLAAKKAADPLGEVCVVAPKDQRTGTGTSSRWGEPISVSTRVLEDGTEAHAVDGTPVDAVLIAISKLLKRRPELLISGINYGENIGSDMIGSGTVGAALEASRLGIPSMAVSVEAPPEYYFSHEKLDLSAAMAVTRKLSSFILDERLPQGVDVLKVDIPNGATENTPMKLTKVSRKSYRSYHINECKGEKGNLSYILSGDSFTFHSDEDKKTDIYALVERRCISVVPLTYDLSAKIGKADLKMLESALEKL